VLSCRALKERNTALNQEVAQAKGEAARVKAKPESLQRDLANMEAALSKAEREAREFKQAAREAEERELMAMYTEAAASSQKEKALEKELGETRVAKRELERELARQDEVSILESQSDNPEEAIGALRSWRRRCQNLEAEIQRKDFEVATLAESLDEAFQGQGRLVQAEKEVGEFKEKLKRAADKAGKANQALLDAQMKNMSPAKEPESSGGFFGGPNSPRGVSQKVVNAAAGQIDHLKTKVKTLEGERDALKAHIEAMKTGDAHYQELHDKMKALQQKAAVANKDLLEAQQKQVAATKAQKKGETKAKAQAKEIEALKLNLHTSQIRVHETSEQLRELGQAPRDTV